MQETSAARTARLFAALGTEHRIRLVELLQKGELCLCEIAPRFKLDQSVVSRHLAILERAGLVRSRRDGRRVLYRLADRRVPKLVEAAERMTRGGMKPE